MIIFGEHEESTLKQLSDVAERAEHVALMADGHLGYIMPIGGVAAYDNQVSVAGVGFDIGCGNCAIRTNLDIRDLCEDIDTGYGIEHYYGSRLTKIADEIASTLSFGIGRTNKLRDAPADHGLFESGDWDAIPSSAREFLREKARLQLGTVGSGNHYVDIFVDKENFIWVGVHFGSRGLGHSIASGFMALAQGEEWSTRVPEEETLLSLDSELGQRYWNAMHLAGLYAHVGREYVARKTVEILGGAPRETVHNHHNFAWKERHFGEDLVVVRKGSTPAFPEQKGFVGGSMGDNAYIVQGVETTGTHVLYPDEMAYYADVAFLQQQAMFSTVHGAGRVMSRSRALGSRPKRNKETGEVIQKRKGEITRQMMSEWVKSRGVIVRGGDVDESPHCYRRLNEVLAAQGDTIEILHTLRPLVVVMAGADVIDPYKD